MLDTMIQQVASSLRKQYPMLEREDIVQELWLWTLEHERTVERYVGDGKPGERMLYSSLRRAGSAICAREKALVIGYDPDDLYYYSTGQLREILPLVMDRTLWVQPGQAQEQRVTGTSDPAHGNTRLAMICDVRSAVEACSEPIKALLWTAFGLAMDDQEHALSLGITEDALRMRVVRALKSVQRGLGGPKPPSEYEGTRRVLSNAQSQAITRNQEGEV